MPQQYAPFCEKQVEYLKRSYSNWLNVAEGGKRAGKNVLNILAWCEQLETHPDKLHLAAGVSNASAKLNIIDSNGFGVRDWFEGRCRQGKYMERDALHIRTATGEKVVLISGGGKEGDERYIKGNTYGTAYVTEANECAVSFIKEVFDRTLSSNRRWIGLDLNPKNPQHWFYEDVLDMHQRNSESILNYGLNYEHFILLDNLSFTDDRIKEILQTYDKTSVWYRRDILGQRSSAEGLIYDMFKSEHLYNDGDENRPNFNLYYTRHYAIDYGTTNPFVILEFIEQKDLVTGIYRYYLNDEFVYDSKKHNRQKEDSEYAEDLFRFIGDKRYNSILVDPSAASFKVTCRNRGLKVRDADNDVENGIRLVAQALRMKRLLVNSSCKFVQQEFSSYIWDEKKAEKGVEEPVKQFDHSMDAIRYFFKTIVRNLPLSA